MVSFLFIHGWMLDFFSSLYSLARPWSWVFLFYRLHDLFDQIPAGLCLLLFLFFYLLFFCMDVTWPSPENLSQQAVVFTFILSWVIWFVLVFGA